MSKRSSLLHVAVLSVLSFSAVMPKLVLGFIAKPSVPEFTVQIVANPYDVPTTHSIDPFNGQDITHEGYHVENKSIVIRIKNQPFIPYEIQESGNNWTINLYYNVRIKGYFSKDWIELYRASEFFPHQWLDSDYTVWSYVLGEGDAETKLGTVMIKLPADSQIDFQLKAMAGYIHREITVPVPGTGWLFTGETSDWSNTQTITIGTTAPTSTPSMSSDSSAKPDQSGNAASSQTDFYGILVAALIVTGVVALIAVGTFLVRRKNRKQAIVT
jgi:hypothetical protein